MVLVNGISNNVVIKRLPKLNFVRERRTFLRFCILKILQAVLAVVFSKKVLTFNVTSLF